MSCYCQFRVSWLGDIWGTVFLLLIPLKIYYFIEDFTYCLNLKYLIVELGFNTNIAADNYCFISLMAGELFFKVNYFVTLSVFLSFCINLQICVAGWLQSLFYLSSNWIWNYFTFYLNCISLNLSDYQNLIWNFGFI